MAKASELYSREMYTNFFKLFLKCQKKSSISENCFAKSVCVLKIKIEQRVAL